MKRLIAPVAVLLSLNLYGAYDRKVSTKPSAFTGGVERFFSPLLEQDELKLDLADVLKIKLAQNPVLAEKLKKDFKVAFEQYNKSFELSVAIVTTSSGVMHPAVECSYAEYKKFIYFLLSQLLQLGYGVSDIYGIDGDAVHDNRQNLLWCWLEVNLLSRYDNRFFERKSEYEETLCVKSLFQVVLPGFCLILSEMIRDGAEIRVVDGKIFRFFGDGTVALLCA
ncbi:MAG: hypothetical protein V1646_00800 [bacterium]